MARGLVLRADHSAAGRAGLLSGGARSAGPWIECTIPCVLWRQACQRSRFRHGSVAARRPDQVRALGHDKVVLVGHSMGGVAITAVAERAPGKILKLVYLTAFMPRSGVGATTYIHAPENEGELVGGLLMSDPAVTAALRMDPRSADTEYRARIKLAFYGDVSQADYDAAAHLLTPDVPVVPFATPIATTMARWGSLPRHYIKALEDRAILPALQQRFIAEADAFVPGNPTRVHELKTSHSPFVSAPAALADLLAMIASS
jgi:pimeloyl-ACP methyl ester carboxylesterase